jgi:hypothetical protein
VEATVRIGKELQEIHSKGSLAQNNETIAWAEQLRIGSEEIRNASSGTSNISTAIRKEVNFALTSANELDSILSSLPFTALGQKASSMTQWVRMKRNRSKIDDLVSKLQSRDRVLGSLILKEL